MQILIETYWPLLLVGLLIGLATAWLLLRANRKTRVTVDRRDVLDEGAAPAARNQALIDAQAGQQPVADGATAYAPPAGGDDLTQIKGLGPRLAVTLNELGVTSFSQIAGWDDADIDRIDSQLDRFAGRIRRDRWVDQARLLSSGNKSAFDAEFGNS